MRTCLVCGYKPLPRTWNPGDPKKCPSCGASNLGVLDEVEGDSDDE